MKYPIFFLTCALFVGAVYAEDATPAPQTKETPRASGQGLARQARRQTEGLMLRGLSDADRARVEDARQKALQDPAIAALRDKAMQANREFMEALQAKVKEIDPQAEEILRNNMPSPRNNRAQTDRPATRPQQAQLSESERTRLEAARKVAEESPKLKAVQELRTNAKSREEFQAAREAYIKALREAVLEADPSLKDVIDKAMPLPPERP